MVRVDMNPARRAISKRHKRRRRIARRRLQKARRQQHQELAAAEAARQARCAAIAKWTEEENKRERRHAPVSPPSRKPLVKFADDVFVTEIPNNNADRLPKPVTSPIGVSIADAPALRFRDRLQTVKFLTVNDEWGDQSDDEENDPEFLPESLLDDASPNPTSISPQGIQPSRLPAKQVSAKAAAQHGNLATTTASLENPNTTTDDHARPVPSISPVNASPTKSTAIASKSPRPKSEDSPETLPSQGKPIASKRSLKRIKPSPSPVSAPSPSQSRSARHESFHSSSKLLSPVESTVRDDSAIPVSRNKKKRRITHRVDASFTPSSSLHAASPKEKRPFPANGHATAVPHASDPRLAHGNGSLAKDVMRSSAGDSDEEEIDNMFVDLVKHRAAKRAAQSFKTADSERLNKVAHETENGRAKKVVNRPTRYTEDGLRIVTFEELAADQPKGLGGPCPFECSCCF